MVPQQYAPQHQNPPYRMTRPAQPSYTQPNYNQHQFSHPPMQNIYEPPRQSMQQMNSHFNHQAGVNFSEEVYRSPFYETREPKPKPPRNHSTPKKDSVASYKMCVNQ
jgi:hypothetical protein